MAILLARQKVFFPIIFFLVLITLFASFFPVELNSILLRIQNFIFDYFSWSYVSFTAFFLFFLIYLSVSKYGNMILGDTDSKPEFSFFTWLSMLFSAGMGIGLMYFGVAEPIIHLSSPISDGQPQKALLYTLFHWSLHPWAIYAVLALVISFLSYRLNLPLSLKSILYPVFKNKIHGYLGVLIDVIIVLAIFFGLIITFALGSAQLNSGLVYLGILNKADLNMQFSLMLIISLIASVSSLTGVHSGVKKLSKLNFLLSCIFLCIFIGLIGKTIILVFIENIGNYLNNLLRLSFNTFSYEKEHTEWFKNWTVFYWAWWVSWAPFVALFIARISKGRTIREFVYGVLFVPSLLAILWFTVFGNTAIDINADNHGVLIIFSKSPDVLLFKFFEFFPFSAWLGGLATFIIFLFFITSVDSGILVLNRLTFSQNDKISWLQSIFWVCIFVLITYTLLATGGIAAIQSLVMVIALPLLFFMLLSCFIFLWVLRNN